MVHTMLQANNFEELFNRDDWRQELNKLLQKPDDAIIKQFFKNINNGRFLEIGSNDGIDGHSYPLLQQGWHGVYCEPDPYACSRLIQNTDVYKDQVTIINSAISPNSSGPMDFYLAINGDNMSSIDPNWLERQVVLDSARQNCSYRNPVGTRKIIVNALNFSDLINRVGSNFDLILTDIEGMDIDLITSIDWSMFSKTKLIVTEADLSVAKHLYTSGGFLPLCATDLNSFYYKEL